MRIGSLVEAIAPTLGMTSSGRMVGDPVFVGDILTIRDIFKGKITGLVCLLFEERKNPGHPHTGDEYGYYPERFRELLPPMDIEAEIENSLTLVES